MNTCRRRRNSPGAHYRKQLLHLFKFRNELRQISLINRQGEFQFGSSRDVPINHHHIPIDVTEAVAAQFNAQLPFERVKFGFALERFIERNETLRKLSKSYVQSQHSKDPRSVPVSTVMPERTQFPSSKSFEFGNCR